MSPCPYYVVFVPCPYPFFMCYQSSRVEREEIVVVNAETWEENVSMRVKSRDQWQEGEFFWPQSERRLTV